MKYLASEGIDYNDAAAILKVCETMEISFDEFPAVFDFDEPTVNLLRQE